MKPTEAERIALSEAVGKSNVSDATRWQLLALLTDYERLLAFEAAVQAVLARIPVSDVLQLELDAEYARRIGETEHDEIVALAVSNTKHALAALDRSRGGVGG